MIRFDVVEEGQKGFGFGREIKNIIKDGVIEGFDSEAIASAEELSGILIPKCKGEHSPEMFRRIKAPA